MIDLSQSGYYIGDCRDLLAQLPDGSVQTCITSPPYWGLRDYGVAGQIGLEATPELYVATMVDVFEGVRRVLADDGTLWLNLGDCYITNPRGSLGTCAEKSTLTNPKRQEEVRRRNVAASSGARPNTLPHPRNRTTDPKSPARSHKVAASRGARTELKHKDLVGIPWMVAFALRAAGWYLRSDIVWHKPNPMPESVTDRPTKAHEYLFLMSKSERYYYDVDAIREPQKSLGERHEGKSGYRDDHPSKEGRTANTRSLHPLGKNRSSVWEAEHLGFAGGRHAENNGIVLSVTPEADGRVPYRSGNKVRSSHADAGGVADRDARQAFGVPWEDTDGHRNKRSVWTVPTAPYDGAHFAVFPPALIEPCVLAGSRPGDIVLDPFFGSGTTGMVAEKHQRKWIGFDINPAYGELAKQRTAQRSLPLAPKASDGG